MGTQPSAAIIDAARTARLRWGIPSSIQLGQFALESAWGTKTSGAHNYFGMKAKPGQLSKLVVTHEAYKGVSVEVKAQFRVFTSDAEAFDAHAKLLATAAVYAPARAKLPNVYAFARALTGVYATDPEYGDKLIAVIHGSELTRFDV